MEEVIVIAPAFSMNAAPHWVALDKGFFREEGVDVRIQMVLGEGDRHKLESTTRGMVFASPAGSHPFKAQLQGREEISVIAVQSKPGHVLVTRPEIESPAELRGRTISAAKYGASYVDACVVLRHFGLDPEKDVQWKVSEEIPPDTERGRLEAVKRGEVDAVFSGPPHWSMAENMGLHRLTSHRDLVEVWPEGGASTLPRVIQEHPDVVKRVVRGLLRGCEFARMNREETIDIILRHTLYADRNTISNAYDALHKDWTVPTNEEYYRMKVEVYCREYKMRPKPLSGYYDFRFVKEAMEELKLFREWKE